MGTEMYLIQIIVKLWYCHCFRNLTFFLSLPLKALLINGHSSFTLTPTDDPHTVTMIEITPSLEDVDGGGKPQGQGNYQGLIIFSTL